MKTNLKLQKIAAKYQTLKFNEDNYNVGGGLSNGAFASNRHQNAKYDEGKLTEGQATQLLKKATELEIEVVKSIINYALPNMEWHHAGRLPKQYGGGMKKTYFINANEIYDLATNWESYFEKYNANLIAKESLKNIANNLQEKKSKFLAENATKITRAENSPNHSHYITECYECDGKYGWFDASKNKYGFKEYWTGWEFSSLEKYNEYFQLS